MTITVCTIFMLQSFCMIACFLLRRATIKSHSLPHLIIELHIFNVFKWLVCTCKYVISVTTYVGTIATNFVGFTYINSNSSYKSFYKTFNTHTLCIIYYFNISHQRNSRAHISHVALPASLNKMIIGHKVVYISLIYSSLEDVIQSPILINACFFS